jgi:outer membrane protein assembly factor BamB
MGLLTRVSSVFLAVLSAAFPAAAGDWPMWRHNAGRTAVSQEVLSDDLHLHWVLELPPATPAFRHPRLQFDRGYEPVAAGGTLFMALPQSDSVIALDAETGKETWRFYAEAPVRFAPVVEDGRVYFGSDDGCLYCVDAITGGQVWRHRAVPSNRKVIGSGRLVSVWPVRGGPVLSDGRVYFAAGIWPFEGTFVYCLDAQSGEVLWLNDRTCYLYGLHPHGAEAFGSLTPHGYLALDGDDLIVPCGSATPAVFDATTGELKSFVLPGAGRLPGGWFVAVDSQEARDQRRGRLVVDSDINRDRHEDRWEQGPGASGVRSTVTIGGNAFSYKDGFEGVPGEIHSILAANGRLFVVTLEGAIYCFGPGEREPVRHAPSPQPLDTPADGWVATAKSVLDKAQSPHGYALVWGLGNGRLFEELVLQSSLNVIAVDTDADRVQALRKRLDKAGLYGSRATVHAGAPTQFGFPPYLASLIVLSELDASGIEDPPQFVRALFRSLRPFGGIACLRAAEGQHDAFREWTQAAGLVNATVQRSDGWTLLTRTGALPGSTNYLADWKSPDESAEAPFGLLWFDDSISLFKRAPQPRIIDGIVFPRDKIWKVKPKTFHFPDALFDVKDDPCVDVYTGRALSEQETDEARRRVHAVESDGKETYFYRPPDAPDTGTPPRPIVGTRTVGTRTNPMTGLEEPRTFPKSYGCEPGVDYGLLFTMRSGTAAYYDKRIESGTVNITGLRSGCTNSIIPANGVLSIPYFYAGCTCSYPLQVGLALVPMPQEFEQWAAWGACRPEAIQRVGLNLGAPGDRVTKAGTLWFDFPSVGGPSPEVAVHLEPSGVKPFYRHSVWIEGGRGWPWVAASGAEGVSALIVEGLKEGSYTVRLYFAEPEFREAGARVFDVAIQAAPVLSAFDVAGESGGVMRAVVKEFSGIQVEDVLSIALKARAGKTVLSGVEIVRAGLPLDPLPELGASRSWPR